MHDTESWGLYSQNGEVVKNEAYDKKENPPEGTKEYVGASDLWLYRRVGDGAEILFQKRSIHVSRSPGLWDVSAGGHINSGETPAEAMVREASEEIGATIEIDKLEYIFTVLSVDSKNIFNHYFLYDWTDHSDDFTFDDQEVSEVKWVPFSEFDDFVDNNAKPSIKNSKHARELTKIFIRRKALKRDL